MLNLVLGTWWIVIKFDHLKKNFSFYSTYILMLVKHLPLTERAEFQELPN